MSLMIRSKSPVGSSCECRADGAGGGHLVPEPANEPGHEPQRRLLVLDEEDLQARGCWRGFGRGRRAGPRHGPRAAAARQGLELDREGRPLVLALALGGEQPAVALDDPLADRQAQSHAAEPAA